MYMITFLDEEQLYHTFCMEGSQTHVCQLDKDLGYDKCAALFGRMSISFGIAGGDLY